MWWEKNMFIILCNVIHKTGICVKLRLIVTIIFGISPMRFKRNYNNNHDIQYILLNL